jgi:hypothetical protein
MMSQAAKRELVAALQPRYLGASRDQKKRILDELVATTGYHRKYAITLLHARPKRTGRRRGAKRKYQGAVVVALEKLWHFANCICAKRLLPALPHYLDALERHGELNLDSQTRKLLLEMSPATADRLLRPARQTQCPHGLSTTKPGTLLKASIPIRTFAQWDDAQPGFTEVDLVAHCGESTRGEYLHSLDMVDITTRWTELVALPNRAQASVSAAIAICQSRLPFALLGLDSDNGTEFINANLLRYCRQHKITFTRCRPYKKNDQAHVEQKNWTAVRQTVGYDRYEGETAYRALEALYLPLRLYLNFFSPVMVLLTKQRNGAKVTKRYDQAKTPYQRVLDAQQLDDEAKQRLRAQYLTLNPAKLLRQIEAAQQRLWSLACRPSPSVTSAIEATIPLG